MRLSSPGILHFQYALAPLNLHHNIRLAVPSAIRIYKLEPLSVLRQRQALGY
jgi:hypothetical protein